MFLQPFVPVNKQLKNLFDLVYGTEIYNMTTANQMYDYLLKAILDVWLNEDAQIEAITNSWQPYTVIQKHMIDEDKTFTQMDLFHSMCVDLCYFIYH
jgi:hypothetical protein